MTGTEKRRATDYTMVASRRAVWEAAYAVAFVRLYFDGGGHAPLPEEAARAADEAIEILDLAMRERARRE